MDAAGRVIAGSEGPPVSWLRAVGRGFTGHCPACGRGRLFGGFLNAARKAVLNLDDPETRVLADSVPADKVIGEHLCEEIAILALEGLPELLLALQHRVRRFAR